MKKLKVNNAATMYALVLFFLSSCIRYNVETWPCACDGVEKEVASFVSGAHPGFNNYKNVEIRLVDYIGMDNGNRIAGLTKYSERLILLDTTTRKWQYDREALVWHELGHYILNREHNDNITWVGEHYIPESVMAYKQYILLAQQPEYIQEYYLHELWNN